MAEVNDTEPEVKDVERVEVTPTADTENIDDEEMETPPDSSQDDKNPDKDDEPETPTEPEKIVSNPPAKEVSTEPVVDIKEVPGETPRERALRLEVTRLKGLQRNARTGEIIGDQPAPTAKPSLSPEKAKILEKYNPEEIQNFREIIDVMAEDMGFVRKDQLSATTYTERASNELNTFLESHPEYLPENDTDNVLWDRFKTEYSMYKQPADPKDFKKIFEKVHKEVFGIKPAGALAKTIDAAKEKVKVASHAGASRPTTPARRTSAAPSGLRLDMLKGFDDEFLEEMEKGE